MLSESDLYNSNTSPDVKVNPKSLGAMWINYTNGNFYICNDNTFNKNIWLDPIGQLTNEINTNVNNRLQQTETEIARITEKVNNIKQLGYNQDWHSTRVEYPPNIVRRFGIWYQNDTDAPIGLLISAGQGYGGNSTISIAVTPPDETGSGLKYDKRPIMFGRSIEYSYRFGQAVGFAIVPPTFYYLANGNAGFEYWSELR